MVRQEGWAESRSTYLTKPEPRDAQQEEAKEKGHFEWPEWSRLQHLDNELGFQFSGSLGTNKNALDCIVLDRGQQKAYK